MYDIVFISYQEPTAEESFLKLKEKFPRTKRVHGIKGIHQAHIAAARKCFTKMIWIVDADALVVDNFNFDYVVPDHQLDHVHVWRSQNPINDLVYGYGGVKLFPRKLTLEVNTTSTDMTTSISNKFKAMPDIANITAFNTDPFSTWKSAFRECAKLSSKVIKGQKNNETEERLSVWTTVGKDKPFGEYCINGAIAGREFGLSNMADISLINNFEWLEAKFNDNT
tara:strand:+ start:26288 stop:26959 length:672 start_codon:yes stop_codon:yes gene_type:complete